MERRSMSDSVGCRIAATAVVVGLIMGGLGFASGLLTHALWVSDLTPGEPTTVVLEVTLPPQLSVESDVPAATPEPPPPLPSPSATRTSDGGEAFDLFWEAWGLIERDFYGELPSDEELTYGAIRGATNTLGDPNTAFISPEAAAINREDDSGSFQGIGAYVSMENGILMIVNTFKEQPAEKAGLRRGDVVLEVDGTPLTNMSLYEAIGLIRGPEGTVVRLTIGREGEDPFDVEVTRAHIAIPVVESELLEEGIGYARLFEFSSDATAKLGSAIEELLTEEPSALILDLRGNPGGWLNEAVSTAGLFLPKEEVVLLERFGDGDERTYRTSEHPLAPDIPMVVLVDGGSASASEIVAGALQDHGRAILIGEQSFGKGSVQWPHELSNGAELRVTVARWFTPLDRVIHGEGLAPDIEVELTFEDYDAGLDPQLDRAIEYLLTGE
jgi:carboxyl-terminal processing protease